MTIKKFAVTQLVTEAQRKRTDAVDLIAWTEERVLRELVSEVYKAGYEGMSWPKVGRVAFGPGDNGGRVVLVGDQLDRVEDWYITAQVEATPRG